MAYIELTEAQLETLMRILLRESNRVSRKITNPLEEKQEYSQEEYMLQSEEISELIKLVEENTDEDIIEKIIHERKYHKRKTN